MMELWPFTNFHDLNLDWIIRKYKKLEDIWEDIVIKHSETVEKAAEAADSADAAANSADAAANSAQQLAGALYYVTPEMYGAIGDGLTDDTVALQEAVTKAGTLEKPLYMRGVYYLSDKITINNDVDIRGCSEGAVIQNTANTPIFATGNTTVNIKIDGLAFTGYGGDYVNTNNTTDNVASAIYCKQPAGTPSGSLHVEKCTFSNFGFAAIHTIRTSEITIKNNVIDMLPMTASANYNFAARLLEGMNKLEFTNNLVRSGAQGVSVGSTSNPVKNINISGNTFENIGGQHGLYIQQGDGINVRDNIFTNIYLNPIKLQIDNYTQYLKRINIVNNITESDTNWAIDLTVVSPEPVLRYDSVIIANNQADGGINTQNVDSVEISGNKINKSPTIGIYTRQCSGVLIDGNQVYNCQANGIFNNSGTSLTLYNVSIINNVVGQYGLNGNNTTDVGIQSYYAANNYIKNNTIVGAGNYIGLFVFNTFTPDNWYIVGNVGTGCTQSLRFQQNAVVNLYDANYFDTKNNSPY